MPADRPSLKTARPPAILTIPELEHAKAAALGTLVFIAFSPRLQKCHRQVHSLVLL